MNVVDLAVLAVLGALLLRGWRRGVAREAVEIVGFLLGAWAGIRLAEPTGASIARWWVGLDPGTARLVGGMVVFVIVSLAVSLAGARVLGVRTPAEPGVPERLMGGVLSGVWGWCLVTVVGSVLVLAPIAGPIASEVERSRLVGAAVDPAQPVQVLVGALTRDRTLQAALGLTDLVGSQHIVLEPGQTHPIPSVAPDRLVRDQRREVELVELVNRARLAAGLRRLSVNGTLSSVAAEHAEAMATGGWFGHRAPDGSEVGDRVAAAGAPFRLVGENLALAATLGIAHEGLMDSPGHRANILGRDYADIGVAVLNSPIGLVVVQVFTG